MDLKDPIMTFPDHETHLTGLETHEKLKNVMYDFALFDSVGVQLILVCTVSYVLISLFFSPLNVHYTFILCIVCSK